MDINTLFNLAREKRASDIHLSVDAPIILRINGELIPINNEIINSEDMKRFISKILNDQQINILNINGEIDFSYTDLNENRYRINTFKQMGNYSMVIRIISVEIPSMENLKLPKIVQDLSKLNQGLVLVTGPSGSGKSTTLASMIDYINKNKSCHILTLEDPIEYIHTYKKSLINQREIENDTHNFSKSLKSALRQDPDVILIGELRDLETISTALTAAETGHLVFSTLHTTGASNTINRIIDVFPAHQQQQIRIQLSIGLEGIISQLLLPRLDKDERIGVFEVLINNQAIKNLIRENKIHQINNSMETGSLYGMKTLDKELLNLYRQGIISKEMIISNVRNKKQIESIL